MSKLGEVAEKCFTSKLEELNKKRKLAGKKELNIADCIPIVEDILFKEYDKEKNIFKDYTREQKVVFGASNFLLPQDEYFDLMTKSIDTINEFSFI